MDAMAHLPARPLEPRDVAALDSDDRLTVVPYGGVPSGGDVDIYAVKLAVGDTAHALGFDEVLGRWRRLATVADVALADADDRLDPVLDDWVQDRYGGRFAVSKVP